MSSTAENQRVNFASIKNQFPYPDFLEVQLKSFQDFLQLDTPPEKRKKEGLYKVFAENFPIADTRNNFVLEFLDYYIDPPRYCIDECIARGLTYSVPLKAKLKLYCTDPDHEDFDTVTQVYILDPIPSYTESDPRCILGSDSVYDGQRYFRDQRRRACCRVSAAPFSGRILRTKHARKRNEVVLRTYYPVQGVMDRVRYGHQQCDVRLHRP